MNRVQAWKTILDRFRSKLSCWKANNLSFAGRVTLAKAVLGNLPTFYLSLFAAPSTVIAELEQIQRHFIWSGVEDRRRIHWVSWEKMSALKEVGGLGIGSLRTFNISLLVKWWWNLKNNPYSLWARVIRGIHNLDNAPSSCLANRYKSGVWLNIARIQKVPGKFHVTMDEILHRSEDGSWSSDFVIDGAFNVAMFRERLDRANHQILDRCFPWTKIAPKKVVYFVWRACMGRIPSSSALVRRGISLESDKCDICQGVEEDADHILTVCPIAKETWSFIMNWCMASTQPFTSVSDALDAVNRGGLQSKERRNRLLGIVFGTLWNLWKARNDRIFNKRAVNSATIVQTIMGESFSWIKYREGKGCLDWENWRSNPLG